MKRFTLIYTLFLLAVALPLLTACYNDDNIIEKETNDGKVSVRLRISQAGAAVTRAGSATKDSYATPEELMNVWTVVITDQAGTVQKILACEPAEEDREIDLIETTLDLETGTYHFYSFANISPEYVKYLLGIGSSSTPPTSDSTFPADYQKGDIIDDITTTGTITLDAAKSKTIAINGNGFDINAENNDFLSKGIPMSNVQTIEVTQPTDGATTAQVIDLIVVRLLAKIELQIYNDKGTDLNIKSITLTDITKNASENSGTANLKLFPRYTVGENEFFPGANEKVDYKHGDIQPNLTNDAQKDDLTITSSTQGVTVSPSNPSNLSDPSDLLAPLCTIPAANSYNEGKGTPTKITFYVNESEKPKGENWGQTGGEVQQFNHYLLKIKINGEELRYALIDDNGTQDNEKWDYIARNDYRIIPIVLDDYKLDIIPYDFPAIGVYPASVKEEDGIYTINFHDYGHFHLQPKVTKYSNGDIVPYGAGETTGDHWALYNNNFTSAWDSWTDATKEQAYSGDFYRTSVTGSVDGDDAGGLPVWYENTSSTPSTPSNPQWASDWAPSADGTVDYQPFIFGYIADPGAKLTSGDKKVYHEFSINLYKSGTTGTARQMTYRLYMILDTDQML